MLWGLFAPQRYLGRLGPYHVVAGDYNAFYCGGKMTGHADPYRVEPLATCESHLFVPATILPVPLPPYDLAALHLQTIPSERRARFLWLGLLLGLLVASAALLQPVVALPWPVIAAVFLLGNGRDEMLLGQIVPFVLVALAGTALCLERGKPRFAALFALVTLAEPHMGVPAVAALFLFVPRSRILIACGAAALAAVSIISVGPATCIEYVTRVLPLHALAEAPMAYQYSLTYVLTMLHVPQSAALTLGTLSYFGMLAVGIVLAWMLARRTSHPAFIALLPSAFVLFGGTFVKQQQFVVAVPLCLLLLREVPARLRAWALAVLFLVALGWEPQSFGHQYDVGVAIVALAIVFWTLPYIAAIKKVGVVVAAMLFYLGVMFVERGNAAQHVLLCGPSFESFLATAQRDTDLASYTWGVIVRTATRFDRLTVALAVSKLITWTGLVGMIVLAVRLAFPSKAPPNTDAAANPIRTTDNLLAGQLF